MSTGSITRRRFLIGSGAALAVGGGATLAGISRSDPLRRIGPGSGLVRAFERQRARPGAAVREVSLVARPATVDLAGRAAATWTYGGALPGPEVRVRAGEVLRATLRNEVPDATTIHWHGIALRNDMDGVPGLTQDPVLPGQEFVYDFAVADPGTYFFHPHTGTQLDRGLYAPLIVEDPSEPGDYDREYVLVLDDWIDGLRGSPDDVLEGLRGGMGGMQESGSDDMGGMDMGATGATPSGGMDGEMQDESSEDPSTEAPLGDDTGDVRYPLYLVNGRPPMDPLTLEARPGERIRLRIVNAGSDTPFRVAVGGHRLTVTHADGFPVEPFTVDALLLGMGERYDAVITAAAPGAFPLVAQAEGKAAGAFAVLRTGPGAAPVPGARPAELAGRLLSLSDLRPTTEVEFPAAEPDRTYDALLTGSMTDYRWGVRPDSEGGISLPVRTGERVRLSLENRTMMWHPLHLHGHTFEVRTGAGAGPRKDTVIVPAMGRIALDVVADNPGQWALHCHNIYHAEVGMQTVLSYVA